MLVATRAKRIIKTLQGGQNWLSSPAFADEMQPFMVSDAPLPRIQADIDLRYVASNVNATLSIFDIFISVDG
jgi:hypothetical protein